MDCSLLATTIALASVISTTFCRSLGDLAGRRIHAGRSLASGPLSDHLVEMLIARFHHPIWTKLASASLVAVGSTALWIGAPVIVLAPALYGASIGLQHCQGHVAVGNHWPSALSSLVGSIAMPSLVAQAAAPSIGSVALEAAASDGALKMFLPAAIVNVLLAATLFLALRRRLPL